MNNKKAEIIWNNTVFITTFNVSLREVVLRRQYLLWIWLDCTDQLKTSSINNISKCFLQKYWNIVEVCAWCGHFCPKNPEIPAGNASGCNRSFTRCYYLHLQKATFEKNADAKWTSQTVFWSTVVFEPLEVSVLNCFFKSKSFKDFSSEVRYYIFILFPSNAKEPKIFL